MQFINFVVDPVRFSIDIYNETGWYEFQLPITLDKNSKVNLLFNLKDLPWGGSGSSNKFYQALENAQKVCYSHHSVFQFNLQVLYFYFREQTTAKILLFWQPFRVLYNLYLIWLRIIKKRKSPSTWFISARHPMNTFKLPI